MAKKNTLEGLPKSTVILGAASTVARYIAMEFARAGHALVLADFDEEECARIAADIAIRFDVPCHTIPFDALDHENHPAFLNTCREKLGGLPGGVVLCFGYMTEQSETQEDFAKAKRTIDTNFTGAVSILEVFAAAFEERKGGFITALSSVAGDRGRKANYIYGASKAGLTAYLEGLRNRLHENNVQVTTVKPGFMDTKMTYGMGLPAPLTASPEQAARIIFNATARGKDIVHVLFMWRYIMLIIRHIPEWQFKKMDI